MIDKKMAAGIILAGAMALTGTLSLAAGEPESANPQIKTEKTIQTPVRREHIQARIKKALDSLVRDGTITQTQEDAVLKAMEQKWQNLEKEREKLEKNQPSKDKDGKLRGTKFRKKHGVLKDLVNDGTITQEQADAIRKAIKSVHENMKKAD